MPEIRENTFKIFGDHPKAIADVGETSVGDGVNARFYGSTGIVEIYSTTKGTINNGNLRNFFTTCGFENIKEIKLLNEVYAPTDSLHLFKSLTNMTSINVEKLDVSKVTNMQGMFDSCKSLRNIEGIRNWNVSNATNISWMFNGCISLKNLNLGEWKVSNVTTMKYMFSGCNSLVELDVSKWNTSSLKIMEGIFSKCSSLIQVDTSAWDTRNVTNMNYMFAHCNNLTELNLSRWDTSRITNMQGMFDSCKSLRNIEGIRNWNVSNATNISWMFNGCISLKNLNLGEWKVSNVTTMEGTFAECNNLTELDVSAWDTSKVTTMEYMFSGCYNVTQLDVSRWNTSNLTNTNYVFYGCNNLTELDVSAWDTSKVTTMKWMFAECNNLTQLDISRWDMSKVTNAESLLGKCNKIEEIYTPMKLPEDGTVITLPKAYRDINKPEERDLSYKEIQKSNDKFSQSIHLADVIFVTFDLDFAQKYFKNEYTENMKPKMYKISEVLKFGSSAETGEKLLPSTTADGKAILWDEETLKNETGYEFLGWECSYDYKYYNIPFVANYFPADVEYKAVFYDKNAIKYDLELTNICKDTGKLLPKAQYNIEGKGRNSILKREYIVNENGTLKIEDLEANEEYVLTERRPSEGYNIRNEPVKFKALKTNEEWRLDIISGNLEEIIYEPSSNINVNTKIKATWEDEILFKIRKVDDKNNQLGLQGAKFTIKHKNTATNKWEDAKDINGKLLGTKETINGSEMNVVTTDEKGYIFEEVKSGEYQITEVDSPEGYKMPENPVQYLNIELLEEEQLKVTESWATRFASSSSDILERVLLTKDGGRIFVGQAGEIKSDDGITISGGGSCLVVKYNEKGQRTWGGDFKYGYPNMVTETSDNGLLIVGRESGMAKYKKNELYGEPEQDEYVIEWESSILTSTLGIEFKYITETSDNGFVIVR